MVISLILQKAKLPKAEKEAFEKELKANIKKVEENSSSDLHYTENGEPQDQKLSKFFEEEVIDTASAIQETDSPDSRQIKYGYESVKDNIDSTKVSITSLESRITTAEEDKKKELKSELKEEKKQLKQFVSDYNKYIDSIFDKATKHYVKVLTEELDNLEVLDETKKPKKEEEKPESDFDVVGDKTVMEYLTSESNQAKLEFLLYDLERFGHASQVVVELNKILERPATSYLESEKAQLPILVDIKLIMSEHKEKISLLEEEISKEYNEIMKSIFDVLGVDAAVDAAVKEYQKDTKVKRNTINFNKKLLSRLEDYKNKALNEKKLPDIYELLDAKTTSEMKNIYFYLKGLSKDATLIAQRDYDNKRKKIVQFKGFESSKTKSKVQIEGEYDSQEATKYTSNNLGYGELMKLGKDIKELLLTEIEGSVITFVDFKTLENTLDELENLESEYENFKRHGEDLESEYKNLKRRGEDKKDIMPPLLSIEIERYENQLQSYKKKLKRMETKKESYKKKLERFDQPNNLLGVLEDDFKEKESLILIGDERKKELQKKFSSLNIFLNAIGKEQKRR